MKKLAIVLATLVAVVLAGAAAGVYAYDQSREGVIAEGTRVAGVDVGGMTTREATAAVDDAVVPRLDRPVRVAYKGRGFALEPEAVRLRVDVDGMVETALAKSRDGNVLARVWRDVTDARVRTSVPLRVDYSQPAVRAFVRRVKQTFDRKPRDARVTFSVTAIKHVPSRTGVSVRANSLRRAIAAQLTRPYSRRLVPVPAKTLEPRVTSEKLRDKYRHVITISRGEKRLRLFRDLKLVKVYPIAVGRAGFETPSGLHDIDNKAVNPAWSAPEWAGEFAGKVIPGGTPQNPLKARWLGFYDGAGIHGTDDVASIGTAASHGCIRMTIPDVIELYDLVPVGATVYIT